MSQLWYLLLLFCYNALIALMILIRIYLNEIILNYVEILNGLLLFGISYFTII